jgi:hypothetical protein
MTKGSEGPLPARATRESPSPAKGERGKKVPRWTIPFLRTLERAGNARASAEEAGIDHTTAYARRRAHEDFAEDWARALRVRSERVEEEQRLEIEAIKAGPSPQPLSREGRGAKDDEGRGAELVASGGQMKRAGHDRWSKRKEKIFFDELAATNNVTHSAKVVGVSPNAVHARRLRDPYFRAKWAAVADCGKAAIHMNLVEEGRKAFNPEDLETGGVQPRVTIDQAIKITQLGGSGRKQQEEELSDPYAEEAARMTPDDVAALREGLVRKLRRMRERDMPDRIAEGWSFDAEHDHLVPPGWVKGVGGDKATDTNDISD